MNTSLKTARIGLLSLAAAFIACNAFADTQLTEQWSIRLPHRATALGSNWVEDGRLRIAIGLDSGTAVIEDQNVLFAVSRG